MNVDVGLQQHTIGTTDGSNSLSAALDPWNDSPVTEPYQKLHAHGHAAGNALDNADKYRNGRAHRHEIDDVDGATVGLIACFQDKRGAAITPPDCLAIFRGRNNPSTVFSRAEQGGEASVRVKSRQAEPIDRTIPADQGRRLAIADKGVLLDS